MRFRGEDDGPEDEDEYENYHEDYAEALDNQPIKERVNNETMRMVAEVLKLKKKKQEISIIVHSRKISSLYFFRSFK